MIRIGHRPVLWHVVRYYAYFGHNEFILCLGYGSNTVKDYFLNYETHSNDFVLAKGGEHIELLSSDMSEWRITFVDTGIDTAIGERLRRVRRFLEGDDVWGRRLPGQLRRRTDRCADKRRGRSLPCYRCGRQSPRRVATGFVPRLSTPDEAREAWSRTLRRRSKAAACPVRTSP